MKRVSATAFFERGLIAIVLLLSACTAMPPDEEPAPEETAAAPPITSEAHVVALQTPVWVQREGKKTPLKPGGRVQAGDTLLTGKGGRVHLSLEDASSVKLGEAAQLEVAQLATVEDDEGSVLTGTLSVLRGAFRLTTSALGKISRRRELSVGIGGVITAGVRGTDIWGKSDSTQDLICLLDGEIDVDTEDGQTQHLDQPMTFYVVPHGQPPKPVAPVPAEKLLGWFPQTELAPGTPALSEDGAWTVGLISHDNESAAQRSLEKLAEQGIPAEVSLVTVKGKTWYRVALAGFTSRKDAAGYRDRARKQGFKTAWIVTPD